MKIKRKAALLRILKAGGIRAKEKLGTDLLDTQLAYSIRFYCMGSVGMTQEWVLKDNITSAETVVQMMFASMPENMRTILF